MTPITPIQQPALEDLKNALQIAQLWMDGAPEKYWERTAVAFGDIARLLKNVLEALSEPNLAAVQAAEILVREYHGSLDDQRSARDVAAGILRAAVTGEIPPTWERE